MQNFIPCIAKTAEKLMPVPGGFPFYQQLEAMDCGATCLRMIARYFGRYYSLDYLRELTYIDKQGVSLLGISDAAEHIGLQSLAIKTTFDRLSEDIPLPCIAHWKEGHFVVVYKASKTHVWIADPAAGKFKLTKEAFEESWAEPAEDDEEKLGILLLLETTPEFLKHDSEKTDKSSLRYVLSYFKKYKALLIQLAVGLILGVFLQFIFPFLIKALIDVGINKVQPGFIALIILAQLVLFTTHMGVEFFRSWILLHVGARVNISLISDFLIKLTKLPISFFDAKLSGDLMQRIADNERIQRFLTTTTLMSFFSFFNFIVFSLVLLAWDTSIFAVFIAGSAINFAWVLYFQAKRREYEYKRFTGAAEHQTNLFELINGMQEIKMYNAEKQKRWSWERTQSKLFRISLKALGVDQLQRSGSIFINESKNLLIIFFAATYVVRGDMSLGMLVAIQYIIGQLNAAANQFVDFMRSLQEAKISLERMSEIHAKDDEEDISNKITMLPETGNLIMEDVTFQYNGPHSPVVLKSVDLEIPKGKITAIVGSSGSGKSTILKLLLGFYKPTEGTVFLGDINLSNIHNRLWRSKCGIVMQEGYVFNDTIARNIALGEESVNTQKLLKAVKIANIQSFIEALPMGYNTRIGSEGMGLSQGQKQRLLIARAIYKDPEFIFFDEATAALDAFNEMVVMENLHDFFRNKTVILVAHRLSTVMNADNIIVVEGGEIVERGTHEELTYVRGAYYQLVRNQLELGA